MKPMDKEIADAYTLISQSTGLLKLSRNEHQRISNALNIIAKRLVEPNEKPKKEVKEIKEVKNG